MVSIGYIIFVSGKTVTLYYISKFFGLFEEITGAVPFIPDLIKEEYHGQANAMKIGSLAIADFLTTGLLGVSSYGIFKDS